MATALHTTASPSPQPPPGGFWDGFADGIARAEAELPALAADLLMLARVVGTPCEHGLNKTGALAGYLARVSEAVRHDPAARRARR